MNVVSDTTWAWILTGLTAGLSGPWMLYDAYNLWRSRSLDRTDPIVRDKRFGYAIGMTIGAIGVYGSLRFHGVL